jgi:hypothetical protein
VSRAASRSGTATTPRSQRKRPLRTISLSQSANDRLNEMAERSGQAASRIVEELVLAADMPRRR